jgi:hypothetical protein
VPCLFTGVTDKAMLKISIHEGSNQRRLVLEGKLIAPWTNEVRDSWARAGVDLHGRELVVDLRNLTAISQDGEDILLRLLTEGVKVRSSGVFAKQVLSQLSRRLRTNVQEDKKRNESPTKESNVQEAKI